MKRFLTLIIGAMLLFSCEGDGVAENDSSAPSVDSDGVATCTVTFDIRGELTTEEVEYDSTIERPEDPDLGEDYIFYGWYYIDKQNLVLLEWGFYTMSVTEDITLYAKMTPELTITFDSNGATEIDPQRVEYGAKITEPEEPTLDGYTFVGWYTSSSLTTLWDFDDPVTEDMTLYAKMAAPVTVTFESNGGTAIEPHTVAYGEKIIEPEAPTLDGSIFVGWYTSSSLTTLWKFNDPVTEDRTLYAKYDTVTNAIYIYNKADLISFRDQVNSGNEDLAAILMDNIDLSGENWTPIGSSSSRSFNGAFYGKGYTISNLTISGTSDDYQGLFGYIGGGSISNLTLKDTQIDCSGYNVAAICGYIRSGDISNCGVEGGSVSGSYYVGGVAGESSSTITSCYNTGEVSGSYYVGGVAGESSSTITSCYNTGKVSGSSHNVGGVVGDAQSSSTITSCYNTGEVSGSYDVGGVAGESSSTITDCYYLPYASVSYTNSNGTEDSDLEATMSSAEFPATLNSAARSDYFEYDSDNYNSGYPILSSIDYSAIGM
ncbi:MAG: InlB B-repeat-containing protein [Rikenellaceae bacterium]